MVEFCSASSASIADEKEEEEKKEERIPGKNISPPTYVGRPKERRRLHIYKSTDMYVGRPKYSPMMPIRYGRQELIRRYSKAT